MTIQANILTMTVVTLALGLACSNDSDDVNLQDGTGAGGGNGELGGASTGGSEGGGGDGGGSAGGGTGNASSGGTDDSGGTSSGATGGAATGGSAIGGADSGGSGSTPTGGTESGGATGGTGGTGGIVCDSPCVAICQGGTCDCECPATGGTAGAGGAETGGATTGGAGGDFGTCGGVVCADAQICCGPPECGYCEPAGASWICHESCGTRPCGPDGLECLNPVGESPPRFFPGEVCVETLLVTGPTPESFYRCLPDPCGTDPLDCSCAQELCGDTIPGPTCDAADPDTLDLYCSYIIAP